MNSVDQARKLAIRKRDKALIRVRKRDKVKKITKKLFKKVFFRGRSSLSVYGRNAKGATVSTGVNYDRQIGSFGDFLCSLPIVRQ